MNNSSIIYLKKIAFYIVLGTCSIQAMNHNHEHQEKIDFKLFCACLCGTIKQIESAIIKGANVNTIPQGCYETPLMLAVKRGDTNMVSALLQLKANPNSVNSLTGKTALHNAYKNQHYLIAKVLESRGADKRIKDLYGKTPLEYKK